MPHAEQAELIDFVVRREFPGSHAPPPPGPRENDHGRRKAIAARRAELARFDEPSLQELAEKLVADERVQDSARRTAQTPAPIEPDATFWCREDEWSLVDAAILLMDLEIRGGLGEHIKQILAASAGPYVQATMTRDGLSDDAQKKFDGVAEVLRRANTAAKLGRLSVRYGNVDPREFLVWARDKGYNVPGALGELVADTRSRAELERALAELRKTKSDAAWPWGARTTTLLVALAAGGKEFASRYESNSPPKNTEVANWLIESGVAERTAKVMAQILAPPDQPRRGGRPKRNSK